LFSADKKNGQRKRFNLAKIDHATGLIRALIKYVAQTTRLSGF
jgi:hypothetical protein